MHQIIDDYFSYNNMLPHRTIYFQFLYQNNILSKIKSLLIIQYSKHTQQMKEEKMQKQLIANLNYQQPTIDGLRFEPVYHKGDWQLQIYKIPIQSIDHQKLIEQICKQYGINETQSSHRIMNNISIDDAINQTGIYCSDGWSFAYNNGIEDRISCEVIYEQYSKKYVGVATDSNNYYTIAYSRSEWKWKKMANFTVYPIVDFQLVSLTQSVGDWCCSIYEMPFQEISTSILIKQLYEQYGRASQLQFYENTRKISDLHTFGEVMTEMQIEHRNIEKFIEKNQIGQIFFFELLINGGNQRISYARDEFKYYIIQYFWS